MENTYSEYVKGLNEIWDMPDNLAVKIIEFLKDIPEEEHHSGDVQMRWFNSLSADEQAMVDRRKAEA